MNKKLIKGFVPIAGFALVMFYSIGPVLADYTAVNQNTGYESENSAASETENESEIYNSNHELIVNVAGIESDTGENSSEENTGSGEVTSGDLEILGGFDNQANLSMIEIMDEWFADFFSLNDTTGAESENEAKTELSFKSEMKNENSIIACNLTEVGASTGDNEADENTGEGTVTTGEIGIMSLDTNEANGISLEVGNDLSEEMSFSATAVNNITGAESDNETEVEVENELDIANKNFAMIHNGTGIFANTGGNSVSENTGSGELETGSADAIVGIMNEVNMTSNTINIEPAGGEIDVFNMTTGHKSDNEAKAEIENEIKLSNCNSTILGNDVFVELNTGDNEVDENTGNASLTTGDATSEVLIENSSGNMQNSSQINIDLSALNIAVGNDVTGADSENEAEASFENEIEVKNSNKTTIGNYVGQSINTGGNSASENTGDDESSAAGTVTSGDAESTISIENTVNANMTQVNFSPAIDISALNSHTGADSENEASAEVSNEIEVKNSNDVAITNTIESCINTGGNSSDENTGSGMVSSGNATITFGAQNVSNGNSTQIIGQ